jgi:hypothetical protein
MSTSTDHSARSTTSDTVEDSSQKLKDLTLKDEQPGATKKESPTKSNNQDDTYEASELLNDQIGEDPNNFAIKHPLQNRWTLWYDNPGKKSAESWEANLKKIVTFDTVSFLSQLHFLSFSLNSIVF